MKPSDAAATTLTDLIRELDTNNKQTDDVKFVILNPPASAMMLNILSVIALPLMLIALIYFLVLRPAMKNGP